MVIDRADIGDGRAAFEATGIQLELGGLSGPALAAGADAEQGGLACGGGAFAGKDEVRVQAEEWESLQLIPEHTVAIERGSRASPPFISLKEQVVPDSLQRVKHERQPRGDGQAQQHTHDAQCPPGQGAKYWLLIDITR